MSKASYNDLPDGSDSLGYPNRYSKSKKDYSNSWLYGKVNVKSYTGYVTPFILSMIFKFEFDKEKKCFYWFYWWHLLYNQKLHYFLICATVFGFLFSFFYIILFNNPFSTAISVSTSKFLTSSDINDLCIKDDVEEKLNNLATIYIPKTFHYGNYHYDYLTKEEVNQGYKRIRIRQSTFDDTVIVGLQTIMYQVKLRLQVQNVTDRCICFRHVGIPLSGGIYKDSFVFMNATWLSYSEKSISKFYSEEERHVFHAPQYGIVEYLTIDKCSMQKKEIDDEEQSACVVMCGASLKPHF